MSRRVQWVLLCEDKQHEAFARRFLAAMGWETRAIRVERAPAGRGAGEQYVRERFPLELQAHRTRPVSQALVVLIDGDREGSLGRQKRLDQACRDSGVAERTPEEPVALFIPSWSIETWLAYLDGQAADEGKPGYPRLARERECQRHVAHLVEMCRVGKLREPAPASLVAACDEYNVRLARVAR